MHAAAESETLQQRTLLVKGDVGLGESFTPAGAIAWGHSCGESGDLVMVRLLIFFTSLQDYTEKIKNITRQSQQVISYVSAGGRWQRNARRAEQSQSAR